MQTPSSPSQSPLQPSLLRVENAKKVAAACLGEGGLGVLVFLLKDGVKKAVELLQTMLQELCSLITLYSITTSTKIHYYTNSSNIISYYIVCYYH